MPEVPESKAGEERLFVPEYAGWKAAIKNDWNKEYCFVQKPGEDFYHLLLTGEIFLQRGNEKYCLSCACVMDTRHTHGRFGSSGQVPSRIRRLIPPICDRALTRLTLGCSSGSAFNRARLTQSRLVRAEVSEIDAGRTRHVAQRNGSRGTGQRCTRHRVTALSEASHHFDR